MAVVRKNSPLDGLSGRVGDLVFRRRAGKTIVARRPGRRDPSRATTEPRQGSMSRFKQAVAFARDARHQPAYRSLCRQLRGASPYHLAIQDFLSEPVIEGVDAGSIGSSGGPLLVTVREKIAVREVRARPVGGAWIRARVMGVATVKPGVREESRGVTPAAPPRRPATPAEMFFRKSQGGAAAQAGSSQAHSAPAHSAQVYSAQPASAHAPSAQLPLERAEQSVHDSNHDDEDGRPDQVTTWRVDIPAPGEIEIAAWDYAGNQTIDRWRVGPAAEK